MDSSQGTLPPVENKGMSQTEDILNRILPPREWTHDGQLWVQYVASTPATRLDVITLQESLDQQLQHRQARETGICPVREELYAQCFDEIIRQVTINCAERGLLLLRVRDELRMTIAAYQTLYESAVAFGMRKALQTEQGKSEMETRMQVCYTMGIVVKWQIQCLTTERQMKLQALEAEKSDLERQVAELKLKCEAIETRENERRQFEEKKHGDEIGYYKKYTEQLKVQLDSYLASGKKGPATAPSPEVKAAG